VITRRGLVGPAARAAGLVAVAALAGGWLGGAVHAQGAVAVPPEVGAEIASARMQGSGRLRFLGLSVYVARLWVGARAAGAQDWAQVPLALELEYSRALVGRLIAERSLEEMRRQGEIAPPLAERWLAEMTKLFPDVKEGDRITGVKQPGVATRIFVNGRLRGEVRDAEFTRMFFGIWLSPMTSEPRLRADLLGSAG
jgi:hypothetical protein